MSSGPPVPRYQHPPAKVREHRTPVTPALLENAFFVVAMVLSFLFAVVVIRQSITHPSHVLYVLVFYAVIAYLALPRLHRVLTTLYVPDYFIGRARTTDGLVGDPVNLAFTGSREQIREVMARAGWVEADPVNLRSAVRIVTASLSRRSYSPCARQSAVVVRAGAGSRVPAGGRGQPRAAPPRPVLALPGGLGAARWASRRLGGGGDL